MYVPKESELPIPLKYIDVLRTTDTDLESKEEKTIDDIWFGDKKSERELSAPWTGRTIFQIVHPKPKPGWEWQDGRLTKKQRTTRPPHVWSENWRIMNDTEKKEAIEFWEKEGPKRDAARDKRGVRHVEAKDIEDYEKRLKEVIQMYSIQPAAALPTLQIGGSSSSTSEDVAAAARFDREHQDHIAEAGFISNE